VKLVIVIASFGQSAAHVPQPLHNTGITLAGVFFFLSTVIAVYGHLVAQIPHELKLLMEKSKLNQ